MFVGCVHRDNQLISPNNDGLRNFLVATIHPIQQEAISEVSKIIEHQKLTSPDSYFGDKCKSMLLDSLSEDFITELFIKKIESASSSQKESINAFSKFLDTEKGALFLSKYDSFIKKQIVQQYIEASRDEKQINVTIQNFFELLHEHDNSELLEKGFGSVLYIQGQVIDYDLDTAIDLIIKKNELKCKK